MCRVVAPLWSPREVWPHPNHGFNEWDTATRSHKMEARAVQLAQSRDSSAVFHVEFQLDFATMVRAAGVAANPLAHTRLWRGMTRPFCYRS